MDAAPMAATEAEAMPRRLSLPLAAKFFLGTAFLIALAVAAAVVVTYLKGEEIARRAVDDALAKSSAVQKQFEQDRLEQLQLKVQLIAADPATAKYVAQASAPSTSLPGLSESRERDTQSIADLLAERKTQYGFDIGIVLDANGAVLGRTDQTEAFTESLADDAFVKPAIAKAEPFSGYWRQGDKLYQAAIMPLQQDRALAGFLLLAQRVDDALARAMARVSGGQIAFWLPRAPALVANSLDEAQAKSLGEALATLPKATLDALRSGKSLRFPLAFAGQNWAANAAPTAEGAGDLGAALALTSSDAIVASYRAILNAVLMAGLAAIAIALLLSYLLTRGILQPVRAMAQAAEQAAAGNYQTRVGVSGSDEVGRLSRAFDSLLADLREKSDIEGYVGSLSRYLPEPAFERTGSPVPATPAPTPMPARSEAVVLLGLEFRDLYRADASAQADAMQSRFESVLARLDGVAQRCGGSLRGLHGARFVLAFANQQRFAVALNALAQIRDESVANGAPAPAAALVSGEFASVSSMLESHLFDAWLGPAMLQVDRLLAEAPAGQTLLARQAGDDLKTQFGAERLAVATGSVSGKSYYALGELALDNLPPLLTGATGNATTRIPPAAMGATVRTPAPGGALRIGSLLGARYEVLAELGSGGMGVVYKAHDRELDDVVALKMLKPAAWADPQQLERLKSEIKLARRITHPNVLRTFDFGEIDGRAFISMEYVRGLTLRYLLNETGRIPYSAALRIARQLGWGLMAAHAVGVLHRDIKPENLILEANGNAKLMDFGIARPARRVEPGQTEAGTFVGTPNYSPPEQLAGNEVDERADIYAAGVVLCEMFCGALPFRGNNTMEIYVAQMQSEPIKPSTHWPEIPPPLEEIIMRCIARNPAERFQSAVELSRALAKLRT